MGCLITSAPPEGGIYGANRASAGRTSFRVTAEEHASCRACGHLAVTRAGSSPDVAVRPSRREFLNARYEGRRAVALVHLRQLVTRPSRTSAGERVRACSVTMSAIARWRL